MDITSIAEQMLQKKQDPTQQGPLEPEQDRREDPYAAKPEQEKEARETLADIPPPPIVEQKRQGPDLEREIDPEQLADHGAEKYRDDAMLEEFKHLGRQVDQGTAQRIAASGQEMDGINDRAQPGDPAQGRHSMLDEPALDLASQSPSFPVENDRDRDMERGR